MRAVILAAVLAIAVSACGKSEEQKAAEKSAEELKQAGGSDRIPDIEVAPAGRFGAIAALK